MTKIFDPRPQIKVKDISDININVLLQETYTITTIMTEKKNPDNQQVSVSLDTCAGAGRTGRVRHTAHFTMHCSGYIDSVVCCGYVRIAVVIW